MSTPNAFPFFDLTRQYPSIKSEVSARFESLLERQALIMGDAVSHFERDIGSWMGVKHAVTCASGTDALILALRALDIGPGDEVITPAYSFFASTSSILLVGAVPVFVDIDPLTYSIDTAKIERAVTKKTKAILPVHLYGQCADMDPILQIGKAHGLSVLEDYAQSIGAVYKGRIAGTMGDAGATSFYPTKNLGGAGDGGLMSTQNDQIADRMKLIRVHGMRVRYQHEFLGTNSRLDALQCAYLNIKLPHLRTWMEMRASLAQNYVKELKGLETQGLVLPKVEEHNTHVWNQFIIRVPNRDHVRAQLQELGVPTEIYYPLTVPEQPPLRSFCEPRGWVESEKAAQSTLALPIFPELKPAEQGLVIDSLRKVLKRL